MERRSKRAKSSQEATRVPSQNFLSISESLKTIGFLCQNHLPQSKTKKVDLEPRHFGECRTDLFSSDAVLYIVSTLKDLERLYESSESLSDSGATF